MISTRKFGYDDPSVDLGSDKSSRVPILSVSRHTTFLPSNVMILRDVLVYNYRSIFIPIDRNLGTNFVENLIWNAELKYAICSVYKNKKWNFKVHRFEEAITIVDKCFTRIKKIYRDKRPLILWVCNTTKYNDYSPVFLRFNNVK